MTLDILGEGGAERQKDSPCFLPGSNRRPCPCEGHVITTTLRKPLRTCIIFVQLSQATALKTPDWWECMKSRSHGATDNASDYGSEDCRFESCWDRPNLFFLYSILAHGNWAANVWKSNAFLQFLQQNLCDECWELQLNVNDVWGILAL